MIPLLNPHTLLYQKTLGKMKILIIIAISLALLLVGLFLLYKIAGLVLLGFATLIAGAIGAKRQMEDNAWTYWESKKGVTWEDLSGDEKEKLIGACMIIADDCGIVCTEERVKELLQEQLPITEPHVGLSFPN